MVIDQRAGELRSRVNGARQVDDVPVPLWFGRAIFWNSETLSGGITVYRAAQRISDNTVVRPAAIG
jgi:hypothetical protein